MLTLLQTPASPFARKVRLVAIARGVELVLEEAKVHPANRNAALAAINPLVKIPVLIAPEGPIYDSRAICRYLDAQGAGKSVYAADDPWAVLRLEALADGIMDAAVVARYELFNRPAELVWDEWVKAQFGRISAALDSLEGGSEDLDRHHVGAIGLAAALDYLDFRHPALAWQTGRPRLAQWLSERAGSPAMQATRYPAP